MGRFESFQQFIATQSVEVETIGFVANLVMATVLALILGVLYVRYGTSLSNRRMFARNFVLMTMTTMLIITIVKSSLALSLGLVGALSIVRFRAAIKEPEELAYLFLAIALGLGFGADQAKITTIGFVIVASVILLSRRSFRAVENQNLHVTVTSEGSGKLELSQVIDILKAHCRSVDLRRFDETENISEASFLIESDNFDQLKEAKSELQSLNKSIHITFMDNKGLA